MLAERLADCALVQSLLREPVPAQEPGWTMHRRCSKEYSRRVLELASLPSWRQGVIHHL